MKTICLPFKAAIGRSSKNLIKDKQSMHAVINNDDLLIEILLRLPVILLLQLKCVCKRWLSLITDPTFTLRRSRIPTLDPPCGALIGKHALSSSGEYYFLSFNSAPPYPRSFPLVSKLPGVEILIMQSCNGLFLCCSKTNANQYYVYNPSINLIKTVPQCSNETVGYGDFDTRIAFDPKKSPHYKVIQALITGNLYSVQIQTYSSEKDMWTVCTCQSPRYNFYTFYQGLYWNDALYWICNDNVLCLKSEDQTLLKTIKPPKHLHRDSRLFETCGSLLLLYRKFVNPLLMDVYEMRKGYPEWVVKYHVNLNDDVSYPRRPWSRPTVYSIVLGEREEDSFILIQDSKKIFKYKLLLKTSHHLYDWKSLQNFYCFQFFTSFAGVGL